MSCSIYVDTAIEKPCFAKTEEEILIPTRILFCEVERQTKKAWKLTMHTPLLLLLVFYYYTCLTDCMHFHFNHKFVGELTQQQTPWQAIHPTIAAFPCSLRKDSGWDCGTCPYPRVEEANWLRCNTWCQKGSIGCLVISKRCSHVTVSSTSYVYKATLKILT